MLVQETCAYKASLVSTPNAEQASRASAPMCLSMGCSANARCSQLPPPPGDGDDGGDGGDGGDGTGDVGDCGDADGGGHGCDGSDGGGGAVVAGLQMPHASRPRRWRLGSQNLERMARSQEPTASWLPPIASSRRNPAVVTLLASASTGSG